MPADAHFTNPSTHQTPFDHFKLGLILGNDMMDNYGFTVAAGFESTFRVTMSVHEGNAGNLFLDLVDGAGNTLTTRRSAVSSNSTITFTLPRLIDRLDAGDYRLEFRSTPTAGIKYQFTLNCSTTVRGNDDPNGASVSADTATQLGIVTNNLLNATRTDRMSSADAADFFKFTTNRNYITNFDFNVDVVFSTGSPDDITIEIIGGNGRIVSESNYSVTRTGNQLRVVSGSINARAYNHEFFVVLQRAADAGSVEYSLSLIASK